MNYLDQNGLLYLWSKIKAIIPTKVSDLANDSGFLTSHQDISGKVDKVSGKQLSTNDYTTAEKNKLSGVADNANNYVLPIAGSAIGGVKSGTDITIDAAGNVFINENASALAACETALQAI